MVRKKEVLTAIGTLGCAMGIGFVMQSSEVAETRYGPSPVIASFDVTPPASMKKAHLASDSLLDVQAITLTSAEFASEPEPEAPSHNIIEVDAEPAILTARAVEVPDVQEIAATQLCEVFATATPLPAAMVDLSMRAPCLPNEKVTIHHNGMIFSEVTSDTGYLSRTIPALAQDAVFIIAFSSGEGAIAKTEVREIADYNRAVLQWKGDAGFQIHAREFGAEYGTQGHLWEQSPGDLAKAKTGEGGFLARYGNVMSSEPLLAEVYTFPRNANAQSGDVVLTVEAEVTSENCGLEVEAQALEMQTDGQVRTRNLILPVPSCDSVGSFLVLNNLLQDLKVAAK